MSQRMKDITQTEWEKRFDKWHDSVKKAVDPTSNPHQDFNPVAFWKWADLELGKMARHYQEFGKRAEAVEKNYWALMLQHFPGSVYAKLYRVAPSTPAVPSSIPPQGQNAQAPDAVANQAQSGIVGTSSRLLGPGVIDGKGDRRNDSSPISISDVPTVEQIMADYEQYDCRELANDMVLAVENIVYHCGTLVKAGILPMDKFQDMILPLQKRILDLQNSVRPQ